MGQSLPRFALLVLLVLTGPAVAGPLQRSTVVSAQDVDTSDDVAYLMSFMPYTFAVDNGTGRGWMVFERRDRVVEFAFTTSNPVGLWYLGNQGARAFVDAVRVRGGSLLAGAAWTEVGATFDDYAARWNLTEAEPAGEVVGCARVRQAEGVVRGRDLEHFGPLPIGMTLCLIEPDVILHAVVSGWSTNPNLGTLERGIILSDSFVAGALANAAAMGTLAPEPDGAATPAATAGERWSLSAGGGVAGPPAVADGVVYVASLDGYLYALDATTGDERWRFEVGPAVLTAPAVADGRVYVGAATAAVVALDAVTGVERWRTFPDMQAVCPPVAAEDTVVTCFGQGIHVLDAAAGTPRWQTEYWQTDIDGSSRPVIATGRIFVNGGGSLGRVYAFDITSGEELWQAEIDAFLGPSPPAVLGDLVFAVGNAGLHAFDVATGEVRWVVDVGTESVAYQDAPAAAAGIVVVSPPISFVSLLAFDAVTGAERWRNEDTILNGPGLAIGGGFVVAADRGAIVGFDAATGEERWHEPAVAFGQYRADLPPLPIVAGGVIFVADGDTLVAFPLPVP